MRREIILAPGALKAFRRLSARSRSEVRDALERHLRFEPTTVSKSRITRLRGLSRPQYCLRVADIRGFSDVTATTVDVLAIITTAEAQAWLEREATAAEGGGPGKG